MIMKPKTKIQIRVDKLSRSLRGLTKEQKEWADKNLFYHYYFRTLKSNTCLECGHRWEIKHRIPLDKLLEVECPRCHTTLRFLPNKKRTNKAMTYFYTATVVEDFQLLRYYHINRFCKVGQKRKIRITEVCQHWIRSDGKRVVRAILFNPMSYSIDIQWRIGTGMEVRLGKDSYYLKGKEYPGRKYLKEIRRNGFRGAYHDLHPAFLFPIILSIPQAETLLKARQYKILGQFAYNSDKVLQYWSSIRICLRNNYMIKEPETWFDQLRLLEYFGLDLLNAKYVCPVDLEADHQRLIRRKQRIENLKEQAERQKEIAAYNRIFKKKKARFFGLELTGENVKVVVLDDVNEYFIEGKELNHCVYQNHYFEKPDTLCLSARKMNNQRLATVEISLKEWKVLQCRGKNNQPPKYYDDIIRLVEDNIDQFRKRIRAHKNVA